MGSELSHPHATIKQDCAGNLTCPDKFGDWDKTFSGSPTKQQHLRTHFSDYNLYPDRFEESNRSQKVRRGSLSSDPPSSISDSFIASSLPTNPISKFNFRIRSSSGSDPEPSFVPGGGENPAERPRASSYGSSKLYYFDFSLIQDKDPHCTIDQKFGDVRTRRRLYSAGDLETHKEESMLPLVLPSSKDQKSIKEEEEEHLTKLVAPRRRKSSEPSRLCFFDFSMIPDKDPRWTGQGSKEGDIIKKE